MRVAEKDTFWSYVQNPTDDLGIPELRALQDYLRAIPLRRAFSHGYEIVRRAEKQALDLPITEDLPMKLAELRGKKKGVMEFLDTLLTLTEDLDNVPTRQ